jgi:hypothetical protein
MTEPTRVSPRQVREKVLAGSALLVCAYDDEESSCRFGTAGVCL